MQFPEILEMLRERFGPAVVGDGTGAIDPWVEVTPQSLVAVCTFLRDEPALRFNMLRCVTGVDYLQVDPKRKIEGQPRIEVIYHLLSLVHKHTLVLKATLPRWKDDVEGQLPEAPTVAGVWRTADWHEREVYDLMGVRFVGHPDLTRILCPDDWEGHPLRKDYQMPLEYHGIRGR